MSVYEGFKLILNCDFVAVADRKFCQIFYGKESLLDEEVAAYSFYCDEGFEKALQLARHFSRKPYFEKMWSAKNFEDQPGGYICMKRLEGPTFLSILKDQDRQQQLIMCAGLATAISELHQYGVAHGALEEDSVLFDPHYQAPVILETITVSFKDQLESENLAPEQLESEAMLTATDVYWLGNLYLRKIKRPSPALKKLIASCTHADPEQRPSIDIVLRLLRGIADAEWQQTANPIIRPKRLLQVAGLALLIMAGVIGFNFWESKSALMSEQAEVYRHVEASIAHANTLPDFDDKVRYLRHEIPTANSIQRSILLEDLKSRFAKRQVPVINDFNRNLQAVFALEVPMILTNQGTLGLGSTVESHDAQGYISEIQRRKIVLQNNSGSLDYRIEYPYLLSTRSRNTTSSIFIPGGKENMRQVLESIAYFYGYELIDEGGQDGVISGYFHHGSLEEFLHDAATPLGLEINEKVITIKNLDELRIFAPVEEVGFDQFENFRELMVYLISSSTDYKILFEDLGPLETKDISKMYTVKMPWKELVTRLGAKYRLENRGGTKYLLISQGESTP